MKKKIIIIPTYNERENVAAIVQTVFALEEQFDIVIIDDNSPDGTANIVKALIEQYPQRLFLIERAGKLGLGTAYITGFRWSIERGYDYIFEMDCDFSHPIEALPRLYKEIHENGYDVAIGSRYVRGGKVKDWPVGRILMSYFASVYVRLITWLSVADTTAGFVAYKREVLETIDLDAIHFKGYAFQIEMKYVAACLGYKLKEIPITFENRKLGSSKMNSSIFGEAFFGVLKLRFWHMFKGYPQRDKKRLL
ncbi:dolichyl-phosphate beta-D-mannosyltransferase [Porphyromonas gingivicanis]|uniref:Dolichyl-phosphate beta-D-mannosyltransferase n=1 Tax=Porphyromonas gingivicanis TaxID=266762 RepID=A0A0A2G569_9PORP|nr:polyprenol monophosphomannose synthase [Porphyromonas gingivicanis]KGN98403.1 dolichyl-phosphate beta-D-mannosyltransferase [Porphyromonas gingivicanis]